MKQCLTVMGEMQHQVSQIHIKLVGNEYFPMGIVQEIDAQKKKFEQIEGKMEEYDKILYSGKLSIKVLAFLASVISLKFLIDLGKWINTHVL